MKKLWIALALLTVGSVVGLAQSTVRVRGYVNKDGTVVQSYTRTKPDSTTANNYSTKGNTNPYTGERGTKSGAKKKKHRRQ